MHIFQSQREQTLRTAEKAGHLRGKTEHDPPKQDQQQRTDAHGLGDIGTCQTLPAARKGNGSGYRSAHSEHQSDTGIYQKQRGCDIYCGQGIATDTAPHEDAVGNDEHGRKDHSQQRREKQFAKQARHLHRAEIKCFLHILFHKLPTLF